MIGAIVGLTIQSWLDKLSAVLARGVWGMAGAPTDSVIIKFDIEDPIALDDLLGGLEALSSQYKRTLSAHGFGAERANAKLYVNRISDGCIEVQLVALGLFFHQAISTMDSALILTDFTKRVGRAIGFFAGDEERPADLTAADTRDIDKFLGTVSDRTNPRVSVKKARMVRQRGQDRTEIDLEFDIDSERIERATKGVNEELKRLEGQPEYRTVRNVLFVWHQTNVEAGKASGRTGDRATIQAISPKPLPVFFPAGAESIKREMTQTEENPFRGRGYMVDVNVQYFGNKPRVYNILDLHGPVDLDDD